jgi:hypothetical protein
MRLAALGLCAILLVPALPGAQPMSRGWWGVAWSKRPSVLIVAPDGDSRIQAAHDAIDFWNRTFAGLGTPFRFGPVAQAAGTLSETELRAMSDKVLSRTGPPELTATVRAFSGDVIILLSNGDFTSFAARWLDEGRALVGIRTQSTRPLSLPNVTRNVIAHELGHAIGLGHNGDPAMLMCGRPAPCRPDAFASRTERFFPLTETEKAELRRLYPPDWASR